MDPVGTLLRTPIFQDLAPEDVEDLLPDIRERRYAKGEIVWIEGDPAEDLLVVAEGQLKSSRINAEGREVILRVHPAGEVTGEVGLFHPGGIRWVGVTAMTPTTCLAVRRVPLLAFLARYPRAMERMFEHLSIEAVHVAYSFSAMAFDDIQRRVAGLVVQLARQHGEPTADGLRIGVRLSQAELAAHVAASRENVNRALSGLVSRRVVSQRAGHFYVHDLAALEQVATGD